MKLLILPNGTSINMDNVLDFAQSGADLQFNKVDGSQTTYTAPNSYVAGQLLFNVQTFVATDGQTGLFLAERMPTVQVLSVDPNFDVPAGGTPAVITGTGFVDGCTVSVNGVDCSGAWVNATTVNMTIPPGQINNDLYVNNPDGSVGVLPNAFIWS